MTAAPVPTIAEIDARLAELGWTDLEVQIDAVDDVTVFVTRSDAPSLRLVATGTDVHTARLRVLRHAEEINR